MRLSNLVERMTVLLHHPALILLYYLRHAAETVAGQEVLRGFSQQVCDDGGSLNAASADRFVLVFFVLPPSHIVHPVET